ncbi:MAG: phosphate acyltransferase PlsX [Thermostichales cyanobacterium SZTDM-1c_bins_54]
MRIAVDAMGGDYAPAEIVKGALLARDQTGVEILLVGEPKAIQPYLGSDRSDREGIRVVPAEGAIGMTEEPMDAIRKKPRASVCVAMDLVNQGEADAVVAAGNTGAAMVAALLRLGRLPGVDRPAIGALLPTVKNKPVLLLDVGANVDCRPKFLEQFAWMGYLHSRHTLGVENPRVGLLNIGEEANKGNDLAVTTHQRLSECAGLNFVGNAEGRDILSGNFDVIICDGFVGNVLLKFAEAIGEVLLQILREELPQGWRGRLGAMLLKPNLRRIKQRVDHAEHGGGLLLGVDGICIVSHGSSQAPSIFNAVRLAKEAVDHEVLSRIQSQHQKTKATATDGE